MKLYELIRKYNWNELEKVFSKHYPEENLDNYKYFYDKIKVIEPEDDDSGKFTINVIHCVYDYYEKEKDEIFLEEIDEYYSVSGTKEGDEDPIKYALEYSRFSHWLGYEVDKESLEKYGERLCIIHIIWEMTFCGFEEETIQNKLEDLSKRVESAKKDLEDGNTDKFISHDEVMKKFGFS